MTASDHSEQNRLDTTFWWLSLAAILLGFLTWTWGELRQATSPRWQDTSGYLAHALYIAEHGGFWGFLRECFAGTFPITERHPLYMLMLAPFAERTADFFVIAKVIDLITGLAVLLSFIWMVTRRYGRGPALIAGLLYAVSNSLVIASSHVNNEMQFVLCTLWTWWFLTEPSAQQDSRDDMPAAPMRYALAGLWLGLAYLAKSPAVLLGVAVVVAAVWRTRFKFVADKRLWIFLAVTALISSPLVIRNLIGFGTLFYEGINSHIMWIDKWTDIGGETSNIYYDQYGVTVLERNGMPTAADYFQTHSLADVVGRLGGGFANELTNVIPTALGPSLQLPRYRLIGLGIFALALAGWWLRRKSWEACLVFFWSAAFLAFFSWDTMFPEIRYLAPLVPVWIAYAAYAAWQAITRFIDVTKALRALQAAVCVAVLGVLGWTVAKGAYQLPPAAMEVSPSYLRFVDWLNSTLSDNEKIMIGETREFHGLIWLVERPVGVVLMSDSTTLEGFLRYLRERNVRYLLMHPEYLTGINRDLAAALAPYYEVSQGMLIEKQPLPGWRAVYRDDPATGHFIVYEPDTSTQSGVTP